MKICVVTSLHKPHSRGGAEVVAETIIQELAKRHDLSVITIEPFHGMRSLRSRRVCDGMIAMYRFYPLNIFSLISIQNHHFLVRFFWHFFDIFNIHSCIVVARIIHRERPECVLTHNIKGIGYLLPLLFRFFGIRHIHTMHDVQLLTPSGLMRTDFVQGRVLSCISAFYRVICKMLFGSPSAVIFPSRYLLQTHQRYGFFSHSRSVHLQNPSDFHIKSSEIKGVRDAFLFLGQLEPHKGINFLLDAWESLPYSGMQLIIAGSGSCAARVCEAAGRDLRVVYVGHQTREQVDSLFSTVRFTVIPTLCAENAPMVVRESLLAGVPVIVTDSGGAAELIRHGENGYIITPGIISELTAILQKATTLTEHEYEILSKNALATAQTFLTVEQYCLKLEELAVEE
jgi:glycosyltransferase involved in cell wall biosynthesis